MSTESMQLINLPIDSLSHIVSFLPEQDKSRVTRTCKILRQAVRQQLGWQIYECPKKLTRKVSDQMAQIYPQDSSEQILDKTLNRVCSLLARQALQIADPAEFTVRYFRIESELLQLSIEDPSEKDQILFIALKKIATVEYLNAGLEDLS